MLDRDLVALSRVSPDFASLRIEQQKTADTPVENQMAELGSRCWLTLGIAWKEQINSETEQNN